MVSRATHPVFLFGYLLTSVNAARILGILPIPAKSHFSCNYAILKSLHAVGHQVTMISPFPPEERTDNFTHVNLRIENIDFVGQSTLDEWADMTVREFMTAIGPWGEQYCHDVMKLPEIQKALSTSEKLYDVLIAEFLSDLDCYLPIAQKLGIPVIATVTMRSARQADLAIGVPSNPAVVPADIGSSTVQMNLMERIENLWNCLTIDYYWTRIREHIGEIGRKYSTEKFVRTKDISLIFYNNHASLLPRLYVPNAIDIGGIHIGPAKPLPKDIQTFIDEASHGVILFTFGSVVRGDSMKKEQREAFLAAFASIPQRVIWKFEEPIKNMPKNIMLSGWLPQRDILEHKNVIAFMSHCGLSGVYEAVITGTPVVTIPLFIDQRSNAALLHNRGVGVDLNFKNITKETILTALNTLINDTSYYKRMQELSHIFKDRPMAPQQSVVYWTEYVIRHNGTPHLKALGTDAPLYQYLMLDIITLATSVLSLSFFVIRLGLKRILKGRRLINASSIKKDE